MELFDQTVCFFFLIFQFPGENVALAMGVYVGQVTRKQIARAIGKHVGRVTGQHVGQVNSKYADVATGECVV